MAKITISEFVTLDGVMQDPGGAEKDVFPRGGWAFRFPDDEGGAYKLDELRAHDALLLGRTTYDGFAQAWPGRTDEAGFADKFNAMPHYVVTSGDASELTWGTSIKIDGAGDLAAQIQELRDRDDVGALIVHGSRRLAQFLIANDLVDELRLMIFPVVLGTGKRLFGDPGEKKSLRLVDSKVVGDGVVILTYAAAPPA